MKINKKFLLVIFIFAIATLASVAAYAGTGFMHNIPTSKYSSLSESDILANYNDTDCTVEASGICTKVVDGDTIEVEGVEKFVLLVLIHLKEDKMVLIHLNISLKNFV